MLLKARIVKVIIKKTGLIFIKPVFFIIQNERAFLQSFRYYFFYFRNHTL